MANSTTTVKRRKKSAATPNPKKMFEEAQMVRRVKAFLNKVGRHDTFVIISIFQSNHFLPPSPSTDPCDSGRGPVAPDVGGLRGKQHVSTDVGDGAQAASVADAVHDQLDEFDEREPEECGQVRYVGAAAAVDARVAWETDGKFSISRCGPVGAQRVQ